MPSITVYPYAVREGAWTGQDPVIESTGTPPSTLWAAVAAEDDTHWLDFEPGSGNVATVFEFDMSSLPAGAIPTGVQIEACIRRGGGSVSGLKIRTAAIDGGGALVYGVDEQPIRGASGPAFLRRSPTRKNLSLGESWSNYGNVCAIVSCFGGADLGGVLGHYHRLIWIRAIVEYTSAVPAPVAPSLTGTIQVPTECGWQYQQVDGAPQTHYRVGIIPEAVAAAGGFSPDTTMLWTFDSGKRQGTSVRSVTLTGEPLASGAYRQYVKVWGRLSDGQIVESAWVYSTFTVAGAPNRPMAPGSVVPASWDTVAGGVPVDVLMPDGVSLAGPARVQLQRSDAGEWVDVLDDVAPFASDVERQVAALSDRALVFSPGGIARSEWFRWDADPVAGGEGGAPLALVSEHFGANHAKFGKVNGDYYLGSLDATLSGSKLEVRADVAFDDLEATDFRRLVSSQGFYLDGYLATVSITITNLAGTYITHSVSTATLGIASGDRIQLRWILNAAGTTATVSTRAATHRLWDDSAAAPAWSAKATQVNAGYTGFKNDSVAGLIGCATGPASAVAARLWDLGARFDDSKWLMRFCPGAVDASKDAWAGQGGIPDISNGTVWETMRAASGSKIALVTGRDIPAPTVRSNLLPANARHLVPITNPGDPTTAYVYQGGADDAGRSISCTVPAGMLNAAAHVAQFRVFRPSPITQTGYFFNLGSGTARWRLTVSTSGVFQATTSRSSDAAAQNVTWTPGGDPLRWNHYRLELVVATRVAILRLSSQPVETPINQVVWEYQVSQTFADPILNWTTAGGTLSVSSATGLNPVRGRYYEALFYAGAAVSNAALVAHLNPQTYLVLATHGARPATIPAGAMPAWTLNRGSVEGTYEQLEVVYAARPWYAICPPNDLSINQFSAPITFTGVTAVRVDVEFADTDGMFDATIAATQNAIVSLTNGAGSFVWRLDPTPGNYMVVQFPSTSGEANHASFTGVPRRRFYSLRAYHMGAGNAVVYLLYTSEDGHLWELHGGSSVAGNVVSPGAAFQTHTSARTSPPIPLRRVRMWANDEDAVTVPVFDFYPGRDVVTTSNPDTGQTGWTGADGKVWTITRNNSGADGVAQLVTSRMMDHRSNSAATSSLVFANQAGMGGIDPAENGFTLVWHLRRDLQQGTCYTYLYGRRVKDNAPVTFLGALASTGGYQSYVNVTDPILGVVQTSTSATKTAPAVPANQIATVALVIRKDGSVYTWSSAGVGWAAAPADPNYETFVKGSVIIDPNTTTLAAYLALNGLTTHGYRFIPAELDHATLTAIHADARIQSDGSPGPVRSLDLRDYAAPTLTKTRYRARLAGIDGASVSNWVESLPVTPDPENWWILVPGDPSLNLQPRPRDYRPIDRRRTVVSSGPNGGAVSQSPPLGQSIELGLYSMNRQERLAIEATLRSGHTMRLIDHLGRARWVRLASDVTSDPWRAAPLPTETTDLRDMHVLNCTLIEVREPA